MALALALFSLAGLVFIAVLLGDGVRVLLARRRSEAAARPLQLIVADRHEAAGQLVRLTLARPRGGRLPAFAAGQYVQLQAPAGRHGKTVQRAYSLAAWRATPQRYELGIRHEAQGTVSGWVRENLSVGSRVTLLPPKGSFVLAAQHAGEIILVGGGIGITPLRAMLHAAIDACSTRRIVLIHAARSAAELLYHDEFRALAKACFNVSYQPLVSRPDAGWNGESGRLDAARLLAAAHDPAQAAFYLCANTALTGTLRAGLLGAGIGQARIHSEAFGTAASTASAGQRIALDHDGRQHELTTAGEPTLLATLEAHDLAPPSECRAGRCGECRMQLVDGKVRWLMQPEIALPDGVILPCICAAVGDLQLQGRPAGH